MQVKQKVGTIIEIEYIYIKVHTYSKEVCDSKLYKRFSTNKIEK